MNSESISTLETNIGVLVVFLKIGISNDETTYDATTGDQQVDSKRNADNEVKFQKANGGFYHSFATQNIGIQFCGDL